ncbi:helix-turn-helix domain-containing protein [Nocardioides humi]|uniref:helix-turn-helix domain-containing protein n=1 Tax=Nocardioides humi TaxID=449461 RepID=UPI0031D773A2
MFADGGARVIGAWRSADNDQTIGASTKVGTSLREEDAGTNAVGTALADGYPKVITGHEHWSRRFTGRTCVAVPVQHPVTRRSAAIIGVALPEGDDARVILALLRWAGMELRSVLQFQEGDRTRALVDQFLRRRRPDRASLLLTDDLCVADTRSTALLSSLDLAVLRSEVRRQGRSESSRRSITLGDGVLVDASVSPLGDDESLFVELEAPARRARGAFVQDVGTSTLHAQALRSLSAGIEEGVPVLVTGEPGTGKLSAARRALESCGSVVAIDVSEDVDAAACVAEFRAAVVRGDGVVLGHVDRSRREVLATLQEVWNAPTRPDSARVVATAFAAPSLVDGHHSSAELTFYRLFAERHVELPPLRERVNDVPRLVAAVSEARGRRVRWAPDALDALMKLPWRGNLRELEQVVLRTLARHPGVVTRADLPADVRAQIERHRLSWMERVERDALLAALDASGGNKVQAALELGISRSSLYRKISQFGL